MTGTIAAAFDGRLGGFCLDAAFTVPAAGVTAIVGPSGAGKTSLLRCIAGLTRLPGRLTVAGEAWQDERHFRPPDRRAIGYVFQEPSLLPHLSVRQNLQFGFKRRGERVKIGFDEAVALLALAPLLDRSPSRLSGGECQRAAIGRALLAGPRLMLMDEPVSSLDAEAKSEILGYLEQLHRTLAVPVIYVSHDLAEVARLADRVLVMRDGRIVAPSPVAAAPAADEAHARQTIRDLSDDRVTRLAVAALLAGLGPAGGLDGDPPLNPPPGSHARP